MSEDEINGDPFAISEDLVQSPVHKQATTNSFDFDGLLSKPLKLHEDLAGGNGGQAWPAGRILAKYILQRRRDDVKDKTIVELGAGGGLVGLAVALGCELENVVHITDLEQMQALMHRNIELNGLEGKVKASLYDWGSERPAAVPAHPDVILAADCVYFEPAFPLLQQTLLNLIGPTTVCYFCFKRRRRADMQFLKTAKKLFTITDITDDPDRETYSRENMFLCEIRRKS
ncbi:S-adenosyl-L-methionine-dependent methyltransferase [Acrodontium crateriforme]|uniref:Protein-lysine N-methyltransferase EFM6 n=1 Tax=Acrodontium crateriforme TaxID=150365 RepID=A0AAQ3RC78_9PEZI|nr:S-adenosyl-L-methionine-dependent methyltransferase [Acrodontium crateriforme]